MRPVPQFDLGRARDRIAAELDERWRGVLRQTAFVLGPEVAEFEGRFAAFLGAAGCVGVANGTDALLLALRALELSAGDEVVVPAFSFFAVAEAVLLAGGRPVFADVEERTLNLDPEDAARRIGERTVGIIGVHLYGRPFDVAGITALCEKRGLWLIEDAAQAHGALWKGRRAGTFGRLTAWSFYPSKNLGCFGDGGAVTGMDRGLLERVRRLANHGQVRRYEHAGVGTNSRLDSLQAAVLNCRLPLLDADNRRRGEIACRYHGALAGAGDVRLLEDSPGTLAAYHQLTLRTSRRDALAAHLAARRIGCAIHYPTPLHRLPPVMDLFGELPALPVAEAAAREVLSLPMFPELTDEEVEAVGAAVGEFFARPPS